MTAKNRNFGRAPVTKSIGQKNGEHFTNKLSEWASKKMINAYGEENHHWTVEEVKSAFISMGYELPADSTWGDAAYSANMAYADYFGMTLRTEADVIKQAYADVIDPDGYPGKIFNRWLADVMGMQIQLDWTQFI